MSFKKLTALGVQILNDLVPLLRLTVCFGIWLVLNLSAEAGVFERLFHRVFGDLKRQDSMFEVFITRFLMDLLELLLKPFKFHPKGLELTLLRLSQLCY